MDYSQTITDYTQDFLTHLGFDQSVAVTGRFDSQGNTYQVLLETKEPGLLIGYHGETLSAIQMLLGMHLNLHLGEWVNLSINVNDYRERRQTAIESMADSVVVRVLSTQQAHTLPPMPANERRLVHLYLQNHPQVSTESTGEGRSRSVVIDLKK